MQKINHVFKIGLILICFNIKIATPQVPATSEIESVARHWIEMIIQKDGKWGESSDAAIRGVYEFSHYGKKIGYFCPVEPVGFLVISIRKELAPVKAYSSIHNIDPESDEGITGFIKTGISRVLNALEKKTGAVSAAPAEAIAAIIEIDYRQTWDNFIRNRIKVKNEVQPDEITGSTPPNLFLLTTHWEQGDPYNRHCPGPVSGDDCTAEHCKAGCTAIAGAQLMRYWCWPPYGSESPYNDRYNWTEMPNRISNSSPSSQINAVAELCYETGKASNMKYCSGDSDHPCASGAYLSCRGLGCNSLEKAFSEKFRYRDAIEKADRKDYSVNGWYDLIKTQIDNNRPMPYEIPGHVVIVDGYQINGGVKEYHVNYGWGDTGSEGKDIWYALDEIYGGNPNEEFLLQKVRPAPSIGPTLASSYTVPAASFPYRYFDMNATGNNTIFYPGHKLQFLPGVVLKCTGSVSQKLQIYGVSNSHTLLFAHGDEQYGIRIESGHINLYQNGSIKLY